MGALRTWSGWKHSSHKLASLCVEASHRRSERQGDCKMQIANCKLRIADVSFCILQFAICNLQFQATSGYGEVCAK